MNEWQPTQHYKEVVGNIPRYGSCEFGIAELANLCESAGLDYSVSRTSSLVRDPDDRFAEPEQIDVYTVGIAVPHLMTEVSASASALNPWQACCEAVVRFDLLIRPDDFSLEDGRCRRCAAPLAIRSVRSGLPRCSECAWPTPETDD